MPRGIPDDRIERVSPAKRALLERWRQSQTQRAAGGPRRRSQPSEPAPLSFAQQRLWFLDRLEPQNPYYNVATAVRLSGPLDVPALETALRRVIDRHEALRTVFCEVDGEPRQIVRPGLAWSLTQWSLAEVAPKDRESALERLAEEESLRPFDLTRGPLIRAALVQSAPDEHVLLLTLHHIVCDGWSMAVLRHEVTQLYEAITANCQAALPELPIQYPDFALWQREQSSGAALDSLLEYWTGQLADLPAPLELPYDRPRPAVQTFRGAVCRRRIDAPLADALRRTARSEEATLFMLLLAGFQLLLSRYSGQRDLCVGSPIAGRNRAELEALIGFFVNTLVLRADLSDNPTVGEFLARTRRATLDAYAHQDLPFEQLVDHLQPRRDLSRTPLFQAMFVLQNIPHMAREAGHLRVGDVRFDHAPVSNFDLTLNVDEHPERLDLSLIYNPDLFEAATVEEMLESYVVLLEGMGRDVGRRVMQVPILSDAARQRLLQSCNATNKPFAADRCVHELISEQAARTPAATALVSPDESLTYEQLEARSNRLARYLQGRGVGHETTVGICLERSVDLIVSLLAVLKAGGAYVPLDPSYPAARREFMIRDSGATWVITSPQLAEALPGDACQAIVLQQERDAIERESSDPPPRFAGANSLAYVLYTSGSTGEPKGVEVEHRGLVNHATALADVMQLEPGDGLLQYLSVSFDAAGEEIFPPLTRGATLHLHPAPNELAGHLLLEVTRARCINVLHLPPPVWRTLFDELSLRGPIATEHLKAVLVGGDHVRRDEAQRWHQQTGGVPLLFAYGVTEATITSTLYQSCDPLPSSASERLPIGRPIANTRVYVLDESGEPVPRGVPGELFIGGVGVARGYRGRGALTATRFLDDPFEPGERLYRTGDRVRFLAEGQLEFLGRLDQQVKVRGVRIEPGEIEVALRTHPAVSDAAVRVVDAPGGQSQLAAYVALSDGRFSERSLLEFLAAQVPCHHLPAAIVQVDRLPRLPNGKIDYRALPRPDWSGCAAKREYVAPSNEVERRLSEIWAAVLGIDRVGTHDNFFDLGGDSIRSLQVVSRAGALGMRFTPKQLFQHQTIAELAPLVQQVTVADQGPVVGPVPLVPMQHELFALAPADLHHFNQSVLLEVRADIRVDVLERALGRLLLHHDALRMRFSQTAEGAWQAEGLPPAERDILERIDATNLADDALAAFIEVHASAVQRSLDPARGQLVRGMYFDLGPQHPGRLLIVAHHLAVDAVSWRVLLEDLVSLCQQGASNLPLSLPPKATSFAEWARRLEAFAAADTLHGEMDFWLQQSSPVTLPRDHDRGEGLVGSTDAVLLQLDGETTAALLHDAQAAYRTRPQELLVAALAETLCDNLNLDEVAIELEGHGREDLFDGVDLSRTVGWFTALYPVRFERPATGDCGGWIRTVKERLRGVPRGGLGFGVLRWLNRGAEANRQLAGLRRPEISFNYLGQFDNLLPDEAPLSLASESTGADRSPQGIRPYLWEIVAYVRNGQLHLRWEYSTDRHRRETVERLAERYLSNLRGMIEHCLAPGSGEVTPSDFPLAGIDQDDLDQIAALLEEDDADRL